MTKNKFENAINWALSLDINFEHKLSLIALISQMDKNYRVEITNLAWSSLLNCSPRSILRYKNALSAKGIIDIIRGKGTLASVYHLQVKELDEHWLEKKSPLLNISKFQKKDLIFQVN